MRRTYNSPLHLMDEVLGSTPGGICAHGAIFLGTENEFLIYVTGISNPSN